MTENVESNDSSSSDDFTHVNKDPPLSPEPLERLKEYMAENPVIYRRNQPLVLFKEIADFISINEFKCYFSFRTNTIRVRSGDIIAICKPDIKRFLDVKHYVPVKIQKYWANKAGEKYVTFKANNFPKDGGKYQFCYLRKGKIMGSSTEFNLGLPSESDISIISDDEYIGVEDPDDPGLIVFKARNTLDEDEDVGETPDLSEDEDTSEKSDTNPEPQTSKEQESENEDSFNIWSNKYPNSESLIRQYQGLDDESIPRNFANQDSPASEYQGLGDESIPRSFANQDSPASEVHTDLEQTIWQEAYVCRGLTFPIKVQNCSQPLGLGTHPEPRPSAVDFLRYPVKKLREMLFKDIHIGEDGEEINIWSNKFPNSEALIRKYQGLDYDESADNFNNAETQNSKYNREGPREDESSQGFNGNRYNETESTKEYASETVDELAQEEIGKTMDELCEARIAVQEATKSIPLVVEKIICSLSNPESYEMSTAPDINLDAVEPNANNVFQCSDTKTEEYIKTMKMNYPLIKQVQYLKEANAFLKSRVSVLELELSTLTKKKYSLLMQCITSYEQENVSLKGKIDDQLKIKSEFESLRADIVDLAIENAELKKFLLNAPSSARKASYTNLIAEIAELKESNALQSEDSEINKTDQLESSSGNTSGRDINMKQGHALAFMKSECRDLANELKLVTELLENIKGITSNNLEEIKMNTLKLEDQCALVVHGQNEESAKSDDAVEEENKKLICHIDNL